MLFAQICEADPDIVCLQEVTPRFLEFLKASDWVERYHLEHEPLTKLKPNGTALLSLCEVTATLYQPYRPPDQDMDRGLLAVRLAGPEGLPLWVGTTWLESPEGPKVLHRDAELDHRYRLTDVLGCRTMITTDTGRDSWQPLCL